MTGRVVTLMIRYKNADGKWQRGPAARSAKGKVLSGRVVVKGIATAVRDATYELRYIENRQPAYVGAGKDANLADAQRLDLEIKSAVIEAAKGTDLIVTSKSGRKSMKETAAAYIRDTEGRGALEAAEQARLVTDEFMTVTKKKTYIDEIDRNDIYKFHATLRKRGCADRTVANKHARLWSWLKFAGVDKGLQKDDPDKIMPAKPRYDDKLPTIYEPQQYRVLLTTAILRMRMCILIALKCGLRDQELMHFEFRDINWTNKTLRIRSKPQWKFHPKTWQERDIPIPDDLLEELRVWMSHCEGQQLVLGTKGKKPDTKLLLKLKGLARSAGLNCGVCDGCQKHNECSDYTLHRFRRTYITKLLRSGVDVRTVQSYAGHKDLASTMRYLTPASGIEAQTKLNSVAW